MSFYIVPWDFCTLPLFFPHQNILTFSFISNMKHRKNKNHVLWKWFSQRKLNINYCLILPLNFPLLSSKLDSRSLQVSLIAPTSQCPSPLSSPDIVLVVTINQYSSPAWNHWSFPMLPQTAFQAPRISSFFIINKSKILSCFPSFLVAATTSFGFGDFNLPNQTV